MDNDQQLWYNFQQTTITGATAIEVPLEATTVAQLKDFLDSLVLIGLSVILYVFAAVSKQGWLAVVRTVSWTLAAILGWYMIVSPLFTKLIQKLLQQKQSRYSDEILRTLSFLPLFRQLTGLAWHESKLYSGFRRWHFFFSALVHWSLTCAVPIKNE